MEKKRSRRNSSDEEYKESRLEKRLRRLERRERKRKRERRRKRRHGRSSSEYSSSSEVSSRLSSESELRSDSRSRSRSRSDSRIRKQSKDKSPKKVGEAPTFSNSAESVNADISQEQANVVTAVNTLKAPESVPKQVTDEILEKHLTINKPAGPPVCEELVSRWSEILALGLPKEDRTTLLLKYGTPANCSAMNPPKLNPEVEASLTEPVTSRDARLVAKQEQVTVCISALAPVLSKLQCGETVERSTLIEALSDTEKLLINLQREESMTRKALIVDNSKASIKDTLNATTIDEWLFGQQLDENIKTANTLERSSKQIEAVTKGSSSFPATKLQGPVPATELQSMGTIVGRAEENELIEKLSESSHTRIEEREGLPDIGTINSRRSGLALLLGSHVGQDERVKRFCKGTGKQRPPAPKYESTWDPRVVLDFFSRWPSNNELSFKNLSLKLITLLALITSHRPQTLLLIDIYNINKKENMFEIKMPGQIETSGINIKQLTLTLPFYPENEKICAASALQAYLESSKEIRKTETTLFISFKKPYKKVGIQTLSRWVKSVLKMSGVDTEIFSAYSTRHADTSAAYKKGISIQTIKKTAAWTKNSKTFAKIYNLEIAGSNDIFARAISG